MQLVTFGINKDKNVIIQLPVFIQPYTQPLILYQYQLETVPVPIIDQNTQVQSHMQLQVKKPYIALDSETYISIRQQELRTCKGISYEFYCEELFVVKHKSRYSCEHVIYFNLVLYNVLLPINLYTSNITTKCHSKSMSNNRNLTGTFPVSIASDSRYFQSS